MKPVRVLIIDDSATIRRLLRAILARDPEIEVVGEAPEPAVARQMIRDLNPDVLTLDVEMPNMTGLEFLEKIMRLRPMPVVMVSTLTQRGAETTLEALELGAVDYFAKPTENVAAALETSATEIANKVKSAARARVRASKPRAPPRAQAARDYLPSDKIVAIGSSTGGVEALITVLSAFPENCPPIVITQHMPGQFTTTFAQRLARISGLKVQEADDGAVLDVGRVYLAPGGEAHLEIHGRTSFRCRLLHTELVNGHRPSVDVLFQSVARCAGKDALGVILTGMGRDGAVGLKAMRDAGASTLGQDEASSVIYGMPRAAFELGAVESQLPLDRIGPEIVRLCESKR
jgi:two-component system chemotaxis response regulator CheB